MQFQRLGEAGHEIPVVNHDGVTRELTPLTSDITPVFFAAHSAAGVASRLDWLLELPSSHIHPIRRADDPLLTRSLPRTTLPRSSIHTPGSSLKCKV